jgi:glycosyltransferase involved in cell wall biosynthesis
MPELSLIIPVMNEADNIAPLLLSVRTALAGMDYEVVLVDDGSTDTTCQLIREHADERTRLVVLRKNYGQSNAMQAGIDESSGDFIAFIDGDLQNDPSDIPGMLHLLKEGEWDLVSGNRKKRQDGFILRKIPSRIANTMIRRITGVYIRDYGCTLKVMTRDIASSLGLYGDMHRFIPVLAHQAGARMTQVEVKHHPRIHGKSKYGLGRTFKVISDVLLLWYRKRYQQKPMHLFGTTGIILCLSSLIIYIYSLSTAIFSHPIRVTPLSWIGLCLFLGGLQLIATGFIADQLLRKEYASKEKKHYTVRQVFQPGKK